MSHLGFKPEDEVKKSDRPQRNGHLVLTVRPVAGATIEQAAVEACEVADKLRVGVRFVFNEASVTAWPSDRQDDVVRRWRETFGVKVVES
jgi:hypothetical protein